MQESDSDQGVDLEKLKRQERILFYQELPLFEDELADHGCSSLTLKFRCMESGFFALLRFYLRVDQVLVRIYDTRIYWETGTHFLIREFICREQRIDQMNTEQKERLLDPTVLWPLLPVVSQNTLRLSF